MAVVESKAAVEGDGLAELAASGEDGGARPGERGEDLMQIAGTAGRTRRQLRGGPRDRLAARCNARPQLAREVVEEGGDTQQRRVLLRTADLTVGSFSGAGSGVAGLGAQLARARGREASEERSDGSRCDVRCSPSLGEPCRVGEQSKPKKRIRHSQYLLGDATIACDGM